MQMLCSLILHTTNTSEQSTTQHTSGSARLRLTRWPTAQLLPKVTLGMAAKLGRVG